MTTTANLIERTRRHLYAGHEDPANRLDGPINDSAETFQLKYPTGALTPGTLLGIGLEEIRVWEASGNTVVAAERGANGTVPAAHDDLATVEPNPKFSRFRILQALNDDIGDLSSPLRGLYWPKSITFTYTSGVIGYDLAGVVSEQAILSVTHDVPGSISKDVVVVPPDQYRIDTNADTGVFPSGTAIVLQRGYTNATYRVVYVAPLGQLSTSDETQNVEANTGLSPYAVDIPPLGAAIALVSAREIRRNFIESQGAPRRASEVPAGATTQSVAGLRAQRQARIGAEAARLNSLYPTYMRTA